MMIFNINITKKYTNKKLEYMFSDLRAENYSMYDTWFKNKFNMSAKDIFKEHYNNFKPTLNQIEKFDVSSLKSSAYSANLAELKYQAAKTFTQADMKNLFSIPYNRDARLKYFTRYTLPDFHNNPVIDKYKNVLNTIDCHPRNLEDTATYFLNVANEDFLIKTFVRTRNYGDYILKHPDINTIKDIMSKKLEICTTQQLEILDYVCTNYESFALIIFEPYMAVCLGNVLFFKVFVPLHKLGAFSIFMNKVNK